LTFELVIGESACDAGDEVGDLYPWFLAGIDEPEIGQLAAGMGGGVGSGDVGYAFWGQGGLFVVYHRDGLGVGAPNGGRRGSAPEAAAPSAVSA
jgi:hypothetical protein